jgi:uncharacterized protein YggE
MIEKSLQVFIVMALFCLSPILVMAQGGGFASGAENLASGGAEKSATSQNLGGYGSIAVTGEAKISVKPQSLRLVLALTTDGETANDCSTEISTRVQRIREALGALKIAAKEIVEDFIVVKRRYKWDVETKNKRDFLAESEDGFHMQTNLHILCKDETMALAAIDEAFKVGVKEVVSFDYWHNDLDRFKKEALEKALAAAKSKSDILLSVFDERPRVMNVNNRIRVAHPAAQYTSLAIDKSNPNRGYAYADMAKVFAERPVITFYEGDRNFSDVSPKAPNMDPTFSVSATVTLTYESPQQRDELELRRAEIEAKVAKLAAEKTGNDNDK